MRIIFCLRTLLLSLCFAYILFARGGYAEYVLDDLNMFLEVAYTTKVMMTMNARIWRLMIILLLEPVPQVCLFIVILLSPSHILYIGAVIAKELSDCSILY